MRGRFCIFLSPAIAIGLFAVFALLVPDSAEAGRLGGGKSMGGRPSYQQSAPRPAQRDPGASQREIQRNQTAQPQTGAPSRWGGMGGMFGGLLMGGLIGSLLFGGAGGFAGPGLLDLLVIGAVLFFVIRLLKARRAATQTAGASYQGPRGADYSFGGTVADPQRETYSVTVPAGFDTDEFLKGAKAAYSRLQASWGKRDLEDIRGFTSPELMKELERQAKEDPTPAPVEVLLVEASLSGVEDRGDERTASVYFDVLMREDPRQGEPVQVKELWHFKRIISDPRSHWVLDGIQQAE